MVCGEGGCGCCVVAISEKDPCEHSESIVAINSVSLVFSSRLKGLFLSPLYRWELPYFV